MTRGGECHSDDRGQVLLFGAIVIALLGLTVITVVTAVVPVSNGGDSPTAVTGGATSSQTVISDRLLTDTADLFADVPISVYESPSADATRAQLRDELQAITSVINYQYAKSGAAELAENLDEKYPVTGNETPFVMGELAQQADSREFRGGTNGLPRDWTLGRMAGVRDVRQTIVIDSLASVSQAAQSDPTALRNSDAFQTRVTRVDNGRQVAEWVGVVGVSSQSRNSIIIVTATDERIAERCELDLPEDATQVRVQWGTETVSLLDEGDPVATRQCGTDTIRATDAVAAPAGAQFATPTASGSESSSQLRLRYINGDAAVGTYAIHSFAGNAPGISDAHFGSGTASLRTVPTVFAMRVDIGRPTAASEAVTQLLAPVRLTPPLAEGGDP